MSDTLYIVVAFDNCYPSGGMYDFECATRDLASAIERARQSASDHASVISIDEEKTTIHFLRRNGVEASVPVHLPHGSAP